MRDTKWIGKPINSAYANTAEECQKFCKNTLSWPPAPRCCFFNWDSTTGDCNLFSELWSRKADGEGVITGPNSCGSEDPYACLRYNSRCNKQNKKNP